MVLLWPEDHSIFRPGVPGIFLSMKLDYQLKRYEGNPIVSPLAGSTWESEVTTNPAAWLDETTGDVLLLYRAAGDDEAHTVHLGLARSRDGYNFERVSSEPVLSPIPLTSEGGCVEDPRIIKIGEWYYVTVATRPFSPGKYWLNQGNAANIRPETPDHFPVALRKNLTSTHLFLTKEFKSWIRAGRLTNPELDDRDVVIFPETVGGKWITIHRPMQWHGEGFSNRWPAIWIAVNDDVLGWKDMRLLAKGIEPWEQKIGANNPPLKTPHGWLQIYHGVGADKLYRLGALLLDLEDPTQVTHRTRQPIYQPEADYETKGIYNGVCFPCGHVVKDGTYFLYYGGGDVHCCVATTPLEDLLQHLLEQPVDNAVAAGV
jgi:beta-1,2-mannobiose phosphorylase / 1,2-beta-oligomannan phosphorylase